MSQFIELAICIIENSSLFVGNYMFSELLGPIVDEYLMHYNLYLYHLNWFRGQNSHAIFGFDYRNTDDPYIGEDYIDFRFLGEVYHYDDKHCEDFNPKRMNFLNN
jgi:hypothetical protein